MSDGISYSIETVALGEQARKEIEIARENGVDPRSLVESHRQIAAIIEHLLAVPVVSSTKGK